MQWCNCFQNWVSDVKNGGGIFCVTIGKQHGGCAWIKLSKHLDKCVSQWFFFSCFLHCWNWYDSINFKHFGNLWAQGHFWTFGHSWALLSSSGQPLALLDTFGHFSYFLKLLRKMGNIWAIWAILRPKLTKYKEMFKLPKIAKQWQNVQKCPQLPPKCPKVPKKTEDSTDTPRCQ